MAKPETIDLSQPGGNDAWTRATGGMVKAVPVKGKAKPEGERTKLQRAFRVAFECIASQHKLPIPKEEFRFHPVRRWRFDFAFPDCKLAVELHGGQWSNGRHNRGSGMAADHAKLNTAQTMGWVVLQYATERMKDPYRVAAEVADILRARIK